MTNFTQRIAQLIGISSHTQLHLLALNDTLGDQRHTLGFLYAQLDMFLKDPILDKYMAVLAFENYFLYTSPDSLKEPFRTFYQQINDIFGSVDSINKLPIYELLLKVSTVITLQKKYFEAYLREHAYKQ